MSRCEFYESNGYKCNNGENPNGKGTTSIDTSRCKNNSEKCEINKIKNKSVSYTITINRD